MAGGDAPVQGIAPKAINTYIAKNFADVKIVAIKKTATNYEVGLSDGVWLKFSLLGQFKSVISSD